MDEKNAWDELKKSDIDDPKLIEKIINYLYETKSSNLPQDSVENALHMNEEENIFVYKNRSWQQVEWIKNTQDFPNFF